MHGTAGDGFHHGDGPPTRPRFHGTLGAMSPVVLRGLLFTFLTLGVYRFWYVTNVRRFLWTNTEVDGDGLDYTGRGVELFIGFLIAVAVLIPFYALIFVAGLMAGALAQTIVQGAFSLGIVVLAQYALFRARRYRLTRTVWRGVRFQQTGSDWAYAWRSLGWGLLSLATLGLAYPFMRASLERYKVQNTWFGDQQGAFSGTGFDLFKRGIALWLIAILAVAVLVGGAVAAEMSETGASPVHWLVLFGLLPLALVLPLYQAIEFRWWAEGCSVGPAKVRCDLGLFAFLKVYLGYVGILLLYAMALGLVGVVVALLVNGAGFGADGLEDGAGAAPFVIGGLVIVAYVVSILVLASLWQLFGVRPIWRKSFESVEIVGLGALMAAQSQAPEANAFGEGIADAIDFGGF